MTIQEILEAHKIAAFAGSDTACACDRTWRTNTAYRAHVAEVLDKYMQERILSCQEHAYLVGYAQANEDIENGAEYPTPNPYADEEPNGR